MSFLRSFRNLPFLLLLIAFTTANAATPELVKDLETLPNSALGFGMGADNQFIYFSYEAPGLGYELFRSDGTNANTGLFLDINPGAPSSNAGGFVTVQLISGNTLVFFIATDESHGTELWRTDGTANGTFVVDLNPGPNSSSP